MPGIAGQSENFDAPVAGDLDGNMSCGAESIQTEFRACCNARQSQASEADDSGAQERCGCEISETIRNRVDKRFRRDDVIGISTVDRIARELCVFTEILLTRPAVLAHTACPMQPRHAD